MPLWMSITFFGSISLILALGIYVVVPFGIKYSIPVFYTYMGTLLFASLIGIALFLILFYLEKKQGLLDNTTFEQRFMIQKPSVKDLLWGLGLLVFWIFTLMIIKNLLSEWLHIPLYLSSKDGTFYGIPIRSNYGLIVFNAIFLIINITGEEFFWRGYMLPRQDLQHGKRAWMVNGILWSFFHSPIYWMAPAIAPGCIALTYVTQKRRSIWPAIIAHLLLNGTDIALTLFS